MKRILEIWRIDGDTVRIDVQGIQYLQGYSSQMDHISRTCVGTLQGNILKESAMVKAEYEAAWGHHPLISAVLRCLLIQMF